MSDGSPPGRAARRRAALDRDGARCLWCGRAFGELVRPTTEHLVPRVKGGPSWSENEAVACHRCNRERGHRTPAEWAEECRRRGWPVDRGVLVRRLEELELAIGIRGGQRRARPYLAAQLRRLRRARRPQWDDVVVSLSAPGRAVGHRGLPGRGPALPQGDLPDGDYRGDATGTAGVGVADAPATRSRGADHRAGLWSAGRSGRQPAGYAGASRPHGRLT